MSNRKIHKDCSGCIWSDVCNYEMPCDYFTPADAEERMDDRAESRRRATFYSDWDKYIGYCSDDD